MYRDRLRLRGELGKSRVWVDRGKDIGWLTHVWGDEHPLRELVGRKVIVEHGEIFDVRKAVLVVGDRVVTNGWVCDWS